MLGLTPLTAAQAPILSPAVNEATAASTSSADVSGPNEPTAGVAQASESAITGANTNALPALAPQPDPIPLTPMAQEIQARIALLQRAFEGADSKSVHVLNEAVVSFYQQRQYRPAWSQIQLSELIQELELLVDDGLNPDDYQVNQLRAALNVIDNEAPEMLKARVDEELRATTAYMRALFHLYNGKVDPAGLDPHWNFELTDLALANVGVDLFDVMDKGSIRELFARTRPQHPIYQSLVAGLKRYRQLELAGGWPALPAGPTLKPCMVDPQIAILRERLRVTGEYVDPQLTLEQKRALWAQCRATGSLSSSSTAAASSLAVAQAASSSINAIPAGPENLLVVDNPSSAVPPLLAEASSSSQPDINYDELFDEHLVAAVKRFQEDQYLEPDGAVGPSTRAVLNISARTRVGQIRVNLDRARWLLHNIPPEMVLVDVAGFKVTYFKANQPIWRSRVQVGMAYRTSPIFKSEVNYITLNPTWTIPPTILRKDVLPEVRKDLNYLREKKIRVLDGNRQELDPASIDWYRPGNITLRQDAGPHSALGKAVIRFPNSHAIYLHDTPHQKLFNKSQRAFSSGCIRVERAMELVELLLAETPGWDREAINQALASGKTRNVTLAKRVPILLAYWTVDAISPDKIAFKPDIYARDPDVLAALDQQK